jgi:hypothetical protein
MNDENTVILAPLEEFDGTVAEFRDILDGLHDERSDPEFPERWPFPHDTRQGSVHVMSEDRLRLGPVAFVDGGIAFRHVVIEIDDERYGRLAVFGLRSSRSYPIVGGGTWARVRPFVVAGWRDAGEAARRMFAHGVGMPSYSTDGVQGRDAVVLTRRSDGVFDWTDINRSPRDPIPDFDPADADPRGHGSPHDL